MMNPMMILVRPGTNKTAFISSCLSLAASNLGAKSLATATVVVAGLMVLPHNQAANIVSQALMTLMLPKDILQVPAKVVNRINLPKLQTPSMFKPNTQLTLRSLEKDYVCVFSGKVTCGGGPCNGADLKVHLASKKNADKMKIVSVQPDGSYTASFLVKAAMNEHVDWWIVADSPESASKQVQGRQILMEETTVTIEEPIRLL